MATKVEELVNSVNLEVARAAEQIASLKDEVRAAELLKVHEALARLEVLNIPVLLAQIATLQEQVAELKKWKEESDRRRWQVLLAIGVCVLTFTSNIVINLLLFFARKPG